VFVTTDPERDTDERLSEWLKAIDPRIIGVRPTVNEAIRIQSELGIQPAIVLEAKAGYEGNYDVSHAAQVVAFAPDNMGRAAYASGTRQSDWAHDIPLLLRMKAK
jgi:protein SCO1/2